MATILFLVVALLQYSAAKVVYKYEGQAIIGIPESGRDANVLRIEFNVAAARVAGTSDLVVTVDPQSVKVHNYTGYLFPLPEGIIATDAMTETISRAESRSNLAAQLAKPLVVTRHVNGTLSNIRHDPSDLYWSVNLKRGLLSLLQLNIQTDDGVYTVLEEDITGSCPSTYLVQSREHYHGHDHITPTFLNVTKSRDYSKCTNRTIVRHSFYSGITLSDEEFAEKNIISNAKFSYNISGTKAMGGQLIVDSACSEAQHIFSVFKPLSGSLSVTIHQRAKLLSVDDSAGTIPSSLMSCSWQMALPNVVSAPEAQKFADSEVVGQVREAVGKLINPDTPNYMRGILLHRILERMRGAKLSAWETIGQAALQASPLHMKLLMDLAPSVGTLEALQKTQEVLPRLTPNITAQFFALSGLLGEPTFPMLGTMKTICNSPSVRETTRETKACMLSYASMIYNRYIRSGYYLKNATFPQEEKAAIADFTTRVDQMYAEVQNGNTTAMLLWVKVAGNLGWSRLIPHLKALAKNESFPTVVRVHAIRAFRRMPAQNHAEIQNTLLPIFTDWHNDVEIRIAAYRAIMTASPSQGTIDLISSALHHEHDEHVRTYVYSHLMTLTRNQLVSEIPLSDRARVALQGLTSIIPTGMQYSRYYRLIDTYDDDRNAGFTLDVSVVGTTRSLWPREMCIWARGVAFGVQGNMAHICLRLQGVQKAMQKLFRSAGPVYPEFFAQLGLNAIEYEEYHGMLDFSVEGSELQFLEIPPVITQSMSDPSVLQARVAAAIQMLRTPIFKTIVLDGTLQVPSLLGLPVQQNNTYAWHLNVSLGQVGFVPACRFNPYQPCQITIKPQGLYQLGSQHSLGVDAGIIQSKVLLHGMVSRSRADDRNWTISFSRNAQNLSVSFEATLPKTRITPAHTEVTPLLITVDRTKATIEEQLYIKEWNAWHATALPDHNWNFELNTTAKLTGFLFGFNKTATKCIPFFLLPAGNPQYPFCGKVIRDFYVIPQADAPDKMQINFRHIGPPMAAVPQPEASFRSHDAASVHDGYDDDEHEHEDHSMMVELSKLSQSLNQELREVKNLREHLEEEDSFAVEEEVVDEHEEVLSRRRRSAYRPGRKDKKPGVGKDRIQRPTDEPDSVMKQRITEQSGTLSLDILGFRNGQVTRKIEILSRRSPTDKPKQYQREFTIKATVGGRQVGAFCGKAIAQYPLGYVPVHLSQDASIEPIWSYISKVQYGTERCESDRTMELHINFSRSNEQKLATQLFRTNSPAAKRFYLIKMCQDEMAKGQTYTWACRHLFFEFNQAHRMEITIKAGDQDKLNFGGFDMRSWISALFLHARVHHWKNLRSGFVRDVKKHSKEISIVGERNFQLSHLTDVTISTPETTSQFQNVYVRHDAPSLYFTMMYSMLYHRSGHRLPGTCVAHKTVGDRMYVSTFDNVVYNTTAPTCPDNVELNILLSADCSASSKFAVFVKFTVATKQMELNVMTAAHQVRLLPTKTGSAEVYVDNVKVVDPKYQVLAGDNELVIKNMNNVIQVRLSIGVYVTLMPDSAVMIGLTPLYSGLTCGLCGDYNGQALDEFTLPDGTLTDNSNLFHTSYVAGIQQCTA